MTVRTPSPEPAPAPLLAPAPAPLFPTASAPLLASAPAPLLEPARSRLESTDLEGTCLGRTCLRWTPDGELDQDDLRQVFVRLMAAEGEGSPLRLPEVEASWLWRHN